MAKAPGHILGEKIGWFFEEMAIDHFKTLLIKHNVYVDYKHNRVARGNNKTVSLKDIDGNAHDLDIVIERNGSEEIFGTPISFIEVAWRSYTKHSKNKVQEISGAVLPIIDRYKDIAPFYGVVLSGDFTKNALKQLKTEGFYVIYFSKEIVFNAFLSENIDIRFDVSTTDDELQHSCELMSNISQENINNIRKYLIEHNKKEIQEFDEAILKSINRRISSITIQALYGETKHFNQVSDACFYLSTVKTSLDSKLNMSKIEIRIDFNNRDYINMVFHEKQPAIIKLREFQILYN